MLLIVRPHPDEPGSTIPVDLLATLHRRGARVSRPGKGASLDVLLQEARALLTLTSATGIQALKVGVPTFTIGPAFYTRPGMAIQMDVNHPEVLRAQLSSGQIERPDKKTVGAFIAMAKKKYAAHMPELSAGIIPATELALKIQENFEIHV
jgi:capsule polysaccharide modification protein KpsS